MAGNLPGRATESKRRGGKKMNEIKRWSTAAGAAAATAPRRPPSPASQGGSPTEGQSMR